MLGTLGSGMSPNGRVFRLFLYFATLGGANISPPLVFRKISANVSSARSCSWPTCSGVGGCGVFIAVIRSNAELWMTSREERFGTTNFRGKNSTVSGSLSPPVLLMKQW